MRKVILIVVAVAVVVCGVGGWFGFQAFRVGSALNESSLTQAEIDAQQVGGDESAVRQALPEPLQDVDEGDIYGDDATQQGKPAGAECVYYGVKPLSEAGDNPFVRFCFADGKLTEKKRLRAEK